MKKKISYFFTELAIVVLGVTIALVFGNINEQRKANIKTEKSIALMLSELKDHEAVLKRVMMYQDTAFKAMDDSLIYDKDYDLQLPKISLNTGAYLFMVNNQVFENIDFNKASEIMVYYTDLRDLSDLEKNLWEAVSENVKYPDKKETMTTIMYWVMQLYSFEQDLLRMNKKLQEELREK